MKIRSWWLVAMIVAAASMRIVPHPPNVTPIAAIALFGGAHFDRRWHAFAVTLGAMLLSDAALELMFGWGFHALLPVVYLTFAAVVGLGVWLRPGRRRALPVAGAAVAASTLFFLITNFAVGALGTGYPPTAAGLSACYVAALPFYGWTLAGDLMFTAALFGGFALAERHVPALRLPALRA